MSHLFSIPPGKNFLETLADTVLNGVMAPDLHARDNGFGLARTTIFFPTRRACRVFSDVLQNRHSTLLLLPRLVALGEGDEDNAEATIPQDSDLEFESLLPAVSPLTRQLIFTQLIQRWAGTLAYRDSEALLPHTMADILPLAKSLGQLVDQLATHECAWDDLRKAVPDDLQEHWQSTLQFLKLIGDSWPQLRAALHGLDPGVRQVQLLNEQVRILGRKPGPFIIAGSTGSMPATARLIKAILDHPAGAVVLPGLDRDLDEASWKLLSANDQQNTELASHPQRSLALLLTTLERTREDVHHLDGALSFALRQREAVVSSALRPASTTEHWHTSRATDQVIKSAFGGVALVEAAHAQEEALAVACLLRETLEHAGKTAALVTPDRTFARRVCAELQRFGLRVDDSSGQPLALTAAGVFARLAVEAAQPNKKEMAHQLLRHPFTRLGQGHWQAEQFSRAAECLFYRGLDAAAQKLFLAPPVATRHIDETLHEAATHFHDRFIKALEPLQEAFRTSGTPLASFAAAHRDSAMLLSKSDNENETLLQTTPDGQALLACLNELMAADSSMFSLDGAAYASLVQALLSQTIYRPTPDAGARLRLYGTLEARLLNHDRLILSGVNETVWPALAFHDPWLSRGVRGALGMPAPEKRIGLAAHDFTQALGHADIWITRALKQDGEPSRASRFLQRLNATIGSEAYEALRARGARPLRLARALQHEPAAVAPSVQPQPRPPAAARPRHLSVTAIETLLRDPYAFYARHILRLQPFEALNEPLHAAHNGLLVHACLHRFTQSLSAGAPCTVDHFQSVARAVFAPLVKHPLVALSWLPLLLNQSAALVDFETVRRKTARRIEVEQRGMLKFDLPAGLFTLTARADRVEADAEQRLSIYDFKTGKTPKPDAIKRGFAVQLLLEGAIALQGGFGMPCADLGALAYLGLGKDGELHLVPAVHGTDTIASRTQETLAIIKNVLARFDNDAMPYSALGASPPVLPLRDYEHLARAREWGLAYTEAA